MATGTIKASGRIQDAMYRVVGARQALLALSETVVNIESKAWELLRREHPGLSGLSPRACLWYNHLTDEITYETRDDVPAPAAAV